MISKRFRVGEPPCEGVRICESCVDLEQLTGRLVNEPLVHHGWLRANILESGIRGSAMAAGVTPEARAVG